MATYKIMSKRLANLGAVGDSIELTEKELNEVQYKVYLKQVEGKTANKKSKAKKVVPVVEDGE